MPVQIINGVRTHYREWPSVAQLGAEKAINTHATILVLHGWGVDSAQYEPLGSMLAEKGFHVIAPDLPGWGNTPAPSKAGGVGEYVEWVREFMENISSAAPQGSASAAGATRGQAFSRRFVLFGHSFGGRIAIKYAIKYPNELRALILCAAAGIKPSLTIRRAVFYCAAKIGRIMFKPPGLSFTGEILKRILYRLAGVNDYFKARGIMKQILAKTVAEDLKPLLPKIQTPTLVLWGAEDSATPYKDGQTMARLISNAKLITFQNARHNLPKSIPGKLAPEIINFLK